MTMDNAGHDARPNQSSGSPIAFSERLTCSVAEASQVIGLSRSKIYELISGGAVRSVTIGRRRLVSVLSLQQLTGGASSQASPRKQEKSYLSCNNVYVVIVLICNNIYGVDKRHENNIYVVI